MAQVTFNNAGAGSGAAATTQDVAYPSSISANDLIILQATIRDTTSTMGAPSGFSALYGPDAASTVMRQYLWYKLAAGTETGNLTVTSGGTVCKVMRMYLFKNQVQSASFYESGGVTSGSNSGSGMSPTAVTPTNTDALAACFLAMADDNAVGDVTGETTGDWAEAVAEFVTTQGLDGCVQLQTANVTDSAAVSGGSVSVGNDAWVIRTFAIKSASPTVAAREINISDTVSSTGREDVTVRVTAPGVSVWSAPNKNTAYDDNFNRSETPLTSPWGSVNGYSTANANGTQIAYSGTGGARYTTSDGWSGFETAEIEYASGALGVGVFLNGWDAYLFKYDSGSIAIYKLSAWSVIGSSYTFTASAGDKFRLEAEAIGTTTYLRGYVNGVLRCSGSDSSSAYSSGACWVDVNGAGDNFKARNYGAATESSSGDLPAIPNAASTSDIVGGNVVQYSDNFNRGDGDLSSPWGSVNGLGTSTISGNQLYDATASGMRYTPSDGASLPQWASLKHVGGQTGPMVMGNGWDQYLFQYDNAGSVYIWKLPAWSALDQYSITVNDGDVLLLEARNVGGSVELKGYVNGTLRCEYTDSSSPFTSGWWGFTNTGYADDAQGGTIGVGESVTLEIKETLAASTFDEIDDTPPRENVTVSFQQYNVTQSDSFDWPANAETVTARMSACVASTSDTVADVAERESVTVQLSAVPPLDVSTPWDETNITQSLELKVPSNASVYDEVQDVPQRESVTAIISAVKADIYDEIDDTPPRENLSATVSGPQISIYDEVQDIPQRESVSAVVGTIKTPEVFDQVTETNREDVVVQIPTPDPYPNIYDQGTPTEDLVGTLSADLVSTEDHTDVGEDLSLKYTSSASTSDSVADIPSREDVTVRVLALKGDVWSQTTTAEDLTVRVQACKADVFDQETVQETVTVSSGGLAFEVYDQMSTTENVDVKLSPAVSTFDSETVEENVTVIRRLAAETFDSNTLQESVTTRVQAAPANVFDSMSTAETVTGIVGTIKCSISDSMTVSDVPVMGSQLLVYTTDTTTATEYMDVRISNPVFNLVYDSTTLTESTDFWVLEYEILRDVNLDPILDFNDDYIWVVTERYSKNAIVLEVETVTESVTCTVQASVNPSDISTVQESITMSMSALKVDIYDQESLTESLTSTIRIDVNKTDLVTVEETVAFAVAAPANIQVDIFDQQTTNESVTTRVSAPAVSVFDQQTVNEDKTISFADQPLPNVFDSETLQEQVTVFFPILKPVVFESETLEEQVTMFMPVLNAVVNENVTVNESSSASTLGSNDTSIYDSMTVQESVTVSLGQLVPSVSDSMSVIETASIVSRNYIDRVEIVTSEDVPTAGLNPMHAITSDTTNVYDTTQRIVNPAIPSTTDDVTVSENISISIGGATVSIVDSISVTDVPTAIISALQASVTDDMNAGESLLLVVSALLVATSDTETVQDIADSTNARWNIEILEPVSYSDIVLPILPWIPTSPAFDTYIIEAPDTYSHTPVIPSYVITVEQERHG